MAETSIDISKAPTATTKVEVVADTTKKEGDAQTSKGGAQDTAGNGATSGDGTKETGDSSKGQDQGKAGETKHPDTGAPISNAELAEYYKEKFSSSTSGAQQLLKEKETLTREVSEVRAIETKLTKEIEDLRKIAEGKNPEGLNLHDLQKSARENAEALALFKENTQLDTFLGASKIDGAENYKEALRTLARANPKTPLSELWENNLKAAAEKAAKDKTDKKTSQQKTAADTGKGTSTREPAGDAIGGYSLEEFNKLPVSKRQEILLKEGAKA